MRGLPGSPACSASAYLSAGSGTTYTVPPDDTPGAPLPGGRREVVAEIVAEVFFAMTRGRGPVGMSFLQRYVGGEGHVEPLPLVLPLDARFRYPRLLILPGRLLFGVVG